MLEEPVSQVEVSQAFIIGGCGPSRTEIALEIRIALDTVL